jgi:hypothetical protein
VPDPQTPPNEDRTRCEVWTRVMGYHRPVSAFNPGKRAEHRDRTFFTGERVAAALALPTLSPTPPM